MGRESSQSAIISETVDSILDDFIIHYIIVFKLFFGVLSYFVFYYSSFKSSFIHMTITGSCYERHTGQIREAIEEHRAISSGYSKE